MDKVLLVSGSDKSNESLSELLKSASFPEITIVKSGNEARRIISQNDFDIIIINAPLLDEFGNDLAVTIATKSTLGVILLVKAELSGDISEKLENYGIIVVSKPIGRALFYQAVKLMSASRRRLLGLQSENIKLQNKIVEIRLVDRAKCVLIQYLNMTEQQAHRYIEKQAMDMRTTKLEVAESILKTYES